MIAHANFIAAFIGGYWRGALIEGASGVGKSDLTLRALAQGFVLVADDRTVLWTSEGRLYGRAPEALQGLLEVRGLDVVRTPFLRFAPVDLICACGTAPERMPEPRATARLGVSIPTLEFAPRETSAPAKLHCALQHLGHRP
jgi:serine kinase of HPr protein (carbohydrate metabolism regulator)